jgi:sugar fermentation stimulation protein A
MKELLVPNVKLLLVSADGGHRKTHYGVLGLESGRRRILLDTRLSNTIAEEAVRGGAISPLKGYALVKREFDWGDSRFDFLLQRGSSKCIAEIKASTLLEGRVAMFPDAPTIRGARHLRSLARAVRLGYRACILFMVYRPGAVSFAPNADTDPGFFESFCDAVAVGVEAYAFECRWKGRRVEVTRRIPLLVAG